WKQAAAGLAGAGLAARFLAEMPASDDQLAAAFGADWQQRVPASLRPRLLPRRWSLLAPEPGRSLFQRNVVIGTSPQTGKPLLADLWQPPPGAPRTGLGIIYSHGSGWRVGD